jgi:hypothetical protein
MDSKKVFYIEAYDFISGLLEYMGRISNELSKICANNYEEKFSNSRDTVNRLNASITKFVEKWGKDDERICDTLRTIKEYYGFYCVTLSNSSPIMSHRDSKYIIDSLTTSKIALTCKLKKIRERL